MIEKIRRPEAIMLDELQMLFVEIGERCIKKGNLFTSDDKFAKELRKRAEEIVAKYSLGDITSVICCLLMNRKTIATAALLIDSNSPEQVNALITTILDGATFGLDALKERLKKT